MNRVQLAIVLLLASGTSASTLASAQSDAPPFMTGALPLTPEEYAALPKVGKFRAWLPKTVDLSAYFPKPGHQGNEPNCTAWATTYAARSFIYGLKLGHQPSGPSEEMSPAYIYNRLRPPGSQCNAPIRIMDALNLLQNEGSVSLADFPDDPKSCPIPAPASLKQKAEQFRLGGWRAIDRESVGDWTSPLVLDDIKGALSRNEPVVYAMPVPDDYFWLKGDATYVHSKPETRNYHAQAIIGYDEGRQAFRVMNSWGDSWADHGYVWISYDTFKLLATEAYALEAPAAGAAHPAPPAAMTEAKFQQLALKAPCGSVQISKTGGHLAVSGFTGSQDSYTELKYAALALDPQARWDVAVTAWPQCEAQLTLAPEISRGVGQMGLSLQSDRGEPIGGDPIQLKAGDKFGIRAETWPARPYLSLFYLQADGSAVELYRGKPAQDAERRLAVNIGAAGPNSVQFQVGAPYGNEVLIAVASAQPLFDGRGDSYTTERQFLTGLRAKLAAAPQGTISAKVLRLRTKQ